MFLVISLAGGLMLGFIVNAIERKNDIERLAIFQPNLPTRIYDIEGRLVSELFQHQRKLVRLEEIPRAVIDVFLAVEDTGFYDHFGIDFQGILRAMIENVKAGSIVQGGSTITQQLVKGIYTGGERTIARKIYEAVMALVVEKEFSKDEILEMYFNQIYLGHGAYGIASASKFYFNKEVSELGIMEGAILSALPKSPHGYSPFRNFHRSYERNRMVLNRLVALGYITAEESHLYYKSFWENYWPTIVSTPGSATIYGEKNNLAPYFTENVRQELVSRFGEDEVYTRGLQVYTSLNLDHQASAEKHLMEKVVEQDPVAAAANQVIEGVELELFNFYEDMALALPLPNIVAEYSLADDLRQKVKERLIDSMDLLTLSAPAPAVNDFAVDFFKMNKEQNRNINVQGAFLSMEHDTGRITAMIGGREFKASDQFNRALMARRQPGSSFKPFVYGAALEERAVHYSSGFLDAPIMNIEPDGSMWAPSNYSGGYQGYVLMNRALMYSINIVSIQIYDMVGPEKISDFAGRLLHVNPSRFQANPSLALGASEVTPLEILRAYSTIANSGKDVIPHSILYVTDRDGNIIYEAEKEVFEEISRLERQEEIQIIEESVAFILRRMMENVVDSGTARKGVREDGEFKYDAAGKTGTTSAWNDAWFVGFTGDLAAVVWMGLDSGSMTLGKYQAGGSVCAPVWGKVMKDVYEARGEKPENFSSVPPRGVKLGLVCEGMGRLPNPDCGEEQVLVESYFPETIVVAGEEKAVLEEVCECGFSKTTGFLELLQAESGLSDEDLEKNRKFKKNYGQ